MKQAKEYYAFISYKREDKKEAKRLQPVLEYYCLPNHLQQENSKLSEYIRPISRSMPDIELGELIVLKTKNVSFGIEIVNTYNLLFHNQNVGIVIKRLRP